MTTAKWTLVSRHWFRRTARLHERGLQQRHPEQVYETIKAKRGPYLWWVVRRTNNTPTST